ncbi:MAG: SRPBCC domain-containing protein [Rhodobacteraceae bacterium]|nr:SRPBCC domain-containing protein [Paracoccaceae bacterium]
MPGLQTSHRTDSIEIRRRYPANRDRVARAFASAEALERWFAPDPAIVIDVTTFVFREGGEFRIQYVMPSGELQSVLGQYTKINLPSELSFTWRWEAPDPHADIETFVEIQFLQRGSETEILLVHHRLATEDKRSRHLSGWRQTLSGLNHWLKTDAPAESSPE